jgi:hypothetical protein
MSSTMRVTISVPRDLINELKSSISLGSISKFLVEAARKELTMIRREKALKELEKLPPAFPEIKDAAQYVHEMRRRDDEHRNKKLGL